MSVGSRIGYVFRVGQIRMSAAPAEHTSLRTLATNAPCIRDRGEEVTVSKSIAVSRPATADVRPYPNPAAVPPEPQGGSLYALLLRQVRDAGLL